MEMISYKDATLDENVAIHTLYNDIEIVDLSAREIYDISVEYIQMIYACEEIDRNHRSRLLNIANHNYNVRIYNTEVVSAL